MPVTIPPSPDMAMPPPNRVRWTRKQCVMMQDAGILVGHYELIEGEIYSKMGQNPPHAFVIRVLMTWLSGLFGVNHLQAQLPVHFVGKDAERNDPEPDIAVLARPDQEFAGRHPEPADIRLIVEASDSSVEFDLTTKALVYGRAGIAEYWVVDIPARRLVVFRDPITTGYASTVAYSETELCAPLASPSNSVLVADLLPPR